MAAEVAIKVSLDGVNRVNAGFDRLTGKLTQMRAGALAAAASLDRAGQAIGRVGTVLTIGLTVPLAGAAVALTKFANDAVESENLFEVAMGDMAKSARDFSEEMREQLGLNAFQTRRTIATFFQMTTAMGISRDAAFEMSRGLTQLTGDMASFFNLAPEEAFLKLQSAISGEIEPLRRLGVSVSEANVQQTLLNAGLIEGSQVLSEQQKILGRYLAIIEQTRVAQGDLARTLESPANRLRALRSTAEQAAIELGQQLTPAVLLLVDVGQNLVSWVSEMTRRFDEMTPAAKGAAVAFGAFLIVLGPLVKLIGLFLRLGGLMIRVLVALTSPVTLVVAGLTALAAAGALVVASWDEIQRQAGLVWASIKASVLENVLDIVEGLDGFVARTLHLDDDLEAVKNRLRGLIDADAIRSQGQTAAGAVEAVVDDMKNTVADVVDDIKELFASLFTTTGFGFEDLKTAGARAATEVNAAFGELEGLSERIRAAFEQAGEAAVTAAKKTTDVTTEIAKRFAQTHGESRRQLRRLYDESIDLEKTYQESRRELEEETRKTIEDSQKELEFNAHNVAESMRSSFQGFFRSVIEGGKSFSDTMKELFNSMVSSILAEFARIASAHIIRSIFGAPAGEREAASQRAAAGLPPVGGGGLFGGIFGSIFGGGFGGGEVEAGTGRVFDRFNISLENTLQGGVAETGSIFGSFGRDLSGTLGAFGGQFSGMFSGFLNQFGSLLGVGGLGAGIGFGIGGTGGGILGAIGGIAGFAIGGPVGGFIGSTLGGLVGGLFQTGGERVVTRPTLFAAGEVGPERVRVTPLAGGRGGGGATLVFQGPVVLDEITADAFARDVARRLPREERTI